MSAAQNLPNEVTMYARFVWFLCQPHRHPKFLRLHERSNPPNPKPWNLGIARRIFTSKYVNKDTLVGEQQMFAIWRYKRNT